MVYISEKKISEFVKAFGSQNQKSKAIEELTELLLAVQRDINGRCNRDNIVEEIADVYIMLRQLEKIYYIQPVELQRNVTYKIERTNQRISTVEREIQEHGKKINNDNSAEADNQEE